MRASFIIRLLIMIIDSRVPRINRGRDEIFEPARRGNMSESVGTLSRRRSFFPLFHRRYLWQDTAPRWFMKFPDNFIIGRRRGRRETSSRSHDFPRGFATSRGNAIEFTRSVRRRWPQRNASRYITTKRDTLAATSGKLKSDTTA